MLDSLLGFFLDNLPGVKAVVFGGPPALLWAYTCLYFAGCLKTHHHLKTGYTRKFFHFLIFTSVAFIHWQWGLPGVLLFGGATSLVIFYAIFRGDGHLLYEAMAREKDAPRRTYFILAPYIATLIGGLASNLLFGHAALIGYLVTGIGDAVGEPVGTRFGRHLYRAPSLSKVKAMRSIEGSAAVLLGSAIFSMIGVMISREFTMTIAIIPAIFLIALAATLTEAVSPHGWDNATMQIVPSFLAGVLL